MGRGRRAWIVSGMLVVLVLAVAWGVYGLLADSRSESAAAGARMVAATKAKVVETVTAAGMLQSSYTANVDFGTGGTVKEINVKVGDRVSEGQQLAKLDDTLASKRVDVARANLDAARQNLSQALSNGTSTDQTKAAIQQAELRMQQAQDTLTATVLTAPHAGTVVSLAGTVGQRVGAGSAGGSSSGSSTGGQSATAGTSAFLVLTDLEQLTMRAKVTEIDASRLATDQQARVIANALPNQPIRARVTEVDLAPTTANGVAQYGVSLALIDPPPQLKPGWSASAQVTVAEANEALAVPSAALRTVGADSTVTVLTGGQEVRRTVRTGVRGDQLVQITSGLHEGEQVVLPSAPVPDQDVGSGKRFWGGG